ncbi:MAG: exodeoxyribonuclease VII large subunit [Planctomycetota bacterium]
MPPFEPPTLTVSELAAAVRSTLEAAFPEEIWVVGELVKIEEAVARAEERGWRQAYFELHEKEAGADRLKASLSAVLWADARERIERKFAALDPKLSLKNDTQARLLCRVDFYAARGQFQLKVLDADPAFALGQMAQARLKLIASLKSRGLFDRNRAVPFPDLPLRIGLVTSQGSAAYHDFVRTLETSRYRFEILLADCRMQGRDTEPEVSAALRRLGRSPRLDLVVLVRGGGSRGDLAWFDQEGIAVAIAECGKPVLTGIGHEIDRSVADEMAHLSFKTPTAAAEDLVARVRRLDEAAQEHARAILALAAETLAREGLRLEGSMRALPTALAVLSGESRRLSALPGTCARAAIFAISGAARELGILPGRLALLAGAQTSRAAAIFAAARSRLAPLARARLARAADRLQSASRQASLADPARILSRGFSILRDRAGRALSRVERIRETDPVRAELSDGFLVALVHSIERKDENGPSQRSLFAG